MRTTAIAAAIALASIAGGCAATNDVDPSRFVDAPVGAEQADALVVSAFGLSDPLPVRWVRGDCWDGIGFDHNGECVFGLTFADVVLVAHPGDGIPASSTALAHERAHDKWGDLGHAQRQGAVDHPIWGADEDDDYEAGTRVGDENAALVAAGL